MTMVLAHMGVVIRDAHKCGATVGLVYMKFSLAESKTSSRSNGLI
jgi:hypothetical protein